MKLRIRPELTGVGGTMVAGRKTPPQTGKYTLSNLAWRSFKMGRSGTL